MKTSVKKTFLDIQKEEEWLNEQGQNGQMLIGYHGGEYVFEDISPLKYQYKIDLPSYTGNKKKEYLDFLEQTGITVVAEYGGRVYLRKNTADGPLDMYSEKKEIEKQTIFPFLRYRNIAVRTGDPYVGSDLVLREAGGRSVLDCRCY